MNREELLNALESALVAQDWQYVQKIQQLLLELGDPESLAKMESILKKAKDLQSQPPIEANSSQVDNLNQANINSPKLPIINLSDSLERIESLAVRMRNDSQIIEDNSPAVYQLSLREEMTDTKRMISKCQVGQPSFPKPPEKVLMVVGATGAGKTTLINGMVNYILGVDWKDDFRFKLIVDEVGKSQAHSQTKLITAYTLHKMEGSPLPYTLTIIDTPGFGDNEGLKRDKFITDQIREFFSMPNGITHLDGIGFVVQNSQSRLTPTQKYIFDSILSIFGKDVATNIFIMITFADAEYPPVMDAINEDKISHSQFFQFNNSAVFAKKHAAKNKKFTEMFWEMVFTSFQDFFNDLEKAETKSLQLTKDVLKERKQLDATVNGLLPQIRDAQLKLNEFLQEEAVLTKFKDQIEENKKFNWTDTVSKQRKIDLRRGEHVTNCLTCNCTCHYPSGIPNDGDKFNCAVMRGDRSNAVCSVCGCPWHKHYNNTYQFELYQEQVKKTYDTIKKRYEDGIQGKIKVESVIACLNKELEEVCEKIFRMIQKVQQCLRRLDEIALKPNPMTQVQYIDLLIDSETREAKVSWEERVKYYQEAREFAVTLSRTQDAAGIKKETDIKEWEKKLISKLKDDKIQEIESASLASSRGKNATENPQSWLESLLKKPFS